MEVCVFGNLSIEGLEVVKRDGRCFVRYDAGTHRVAWREDDISSDEFARLQMGGVSEYETIVAMQRRIRLKGDGPHAQNWAPSDG